jgi:hypothetical protein
MTRSILLLVVAFLIALPAHALGQTVSAPVPTAPTVTDGCVLTGMVVDQDHQPIEHARIVLENGLWTSSGPDGSFTLGAIPPGQHQVQISARGHRTGQGAITFGPGQQKSMLVSLTSLDARAERPRSKPGTFYIQAYEYRSGNKRYYVKRVQVSQTDDPSKSWSQYRWNGNDGPGFYLPCEDAVLGRTYSVNITWRTWPDPDGMNDDEELNGSWYKKFDSDGETMTFYNPW